jgi:CubicO group peptidase (beta-lactamase class C family)
MALGTFFSAAVVASTFCRLGAAAVQAPLGLFSAASERGSQNPFNDDLGNFVDNVMERWKIPGMSVAVIDGDDVYTEVRAAVEIAPTQENKFSG